MRVELQLARSEVRDVRELELTATLTNDEDRPVTLNTLFLPMSAVVLEVRDATGNRVPLAPPPVPPLDDGHTGRERLVPGASITFRYAGATVFGVSPPPGTHAVRFSFEAAGAGATGDWQGLLESDWAPFTLLGPAARRG